MKPTSPFRVMMIALGVIVVVAIAPLLSVLAATGIATAAGCRLDEGSAHPCVVLGIDLADMLYGLFVLGWLMLATLPLGGLALLVWLVVAVVLYLRRKPANG